MRAIDRFAAAVREQAPRLAVVLGSGLGNVPARRQEIAAIDFADVPGLTAPTVRGHSGSIALLRCAGRPLLAFRGRLHFYEGHNWDRVAAPIRLAARWGVTDVLLTNAAGGIHDALGPGDLLILRDHLDLQRPNAWIPTGARQPAYAPHLIERLQAIDTRLMVGVYAAVTGPSYETPAEIRALRAMGADAVGMSTAREARTAVECGMAVAAISCITNKAAGLSAAPLDHREVLANAAKPADRLSTILEAFVLEP